MDSVRQTESSVVEPRACEHEFRRLFDGEYRVGHRCVNCNRAVLGDDGVIRDEQTYEVLGRANPPEKWPEPEVEDGESEDIGFEGTLLEGEI